MALDEDIVEDLVLSSDEDAPLSDSPDEDDDDDEAEDDQQERSSSKKRKHGEGKQNGGNRKSKKKRKTHGSIGICRGRGGSIFVAMQRNVGGVEDLLVAGGDGCEGYEVAGGGRGAREGEGAGMETCRCCEWWWISEEGIAEFDFG
ncbi:uncharacterized protein LOC121770240 [Salvia splendens]|uniref:uncharacterized protein LOC121770240 n=1 Tax=Salvia splendens TaxID=180675 RepID=UPI001C274D1E|nr:uncharacterized protein LOC121770240 [Salvia splendens]